jgi:hypothetical protein
MGALVNKWTHVNIPLVVSKITGQDGQVRVTTVQTILDQLMPGLVPLLLTFACMWLLRKKVNPCGSSLASSSSVSRLRCRPAGSVIPRCTPGACPGFFFGGWMTITDLVIILFILVLLAFAIYDQFIMPRRNGPFCWPSPAPPQSR